MFSLNVGGLSDNGRVDWFGYWSWVISRSGSWISGILDRLVSLIKKIVKMVPAKQNPPKNHIVFISPIPSSISPKRRVNASAASQFINAIDTAAPSFTWGVNISPKKTQAIGPTPRLNAPKNKAVQVSGIHESSSAYSGSSCCTVENQPDVKRMRKKENGKRRSTISDENIYRAKIRSFPSALKTRLAAVYGPRCRL